MTLEHIIIETFLTISGIFALVYLVRSYQDLKAAQAELDRLRNPKNSKK